MKNKSAIMLFLICSVFLFLSADIATANAGKAIGGAGKYAPQLFLLGAGLFGKLAGIGAVIGAGVFARGKVQDVKIGAFVVAAIGGIWTAYNWFGWPFHEVRVHYSYFMEPYSREEFSFFRLIGCGILGALGFGASLIISKLDDKE